MPHGTNEKASTTMSSKATPDPLPKGEQALEEELFARMGQTKTYPLDLQPLSTSPATPEPEEETDEETIRRAYPSLTDKQIQSILQTI